MHLNKPTETEKPKKHWLKWTAIGVGIMLVVSVIYLATAVAHAATSIDGLVEILETGLNSLKATLEWLLEMLREILY